jgi:hypothetical protein
MKRDAIAANGTRSADQLADWIERDMRMSHVYQPGVLRALLDAGGVPTIAFDSPSSMCGQRWSSRRWPGGLGVPKASPKLTRRTLQ